MRREANSPAVPAAAVPGPSSGGPSLVWHLMWHDLEASRPLLAAWLGALALQFAALWLGPADPAAPAAPGISLADAGIVMRLAMTVVLVASVVQRHPLVGTTAFWRTRPVPGSTVFASTVTFLVLIVVMLPTAWFAGAAWWLGLDLNASLWSAVDVAVEQLAVAGVALALASISLNLAQAIVSGVAVFLFLGAARLAFMATFQRSHWLSFAVSSVDWIPEIVLALAGVATATVSLHQHVTLKTWRSYGLLAGLVLLLASLSVWPLWSGTDRREFPPAAAAAAIPELELDRDSIRWEHFVRTSSAGRQVGIRHNAVLRWKGPGADAVVLEPVTIDSRLRFPDGVETRFAPRFVTAGAESASPQAAAAQPRAAMAAALGTGQIGDSIELLDRQTRVVVLETASDTFAVRGTQPAELTVSLVCNAYRYVIANRVPLVVGREARSPGSTIVFEGTTPLSPGVAVTLRDTYIRPLDAVAPAQYVLYNARLREAIPMASTSPTVLRSTLIDQRSFRVARIRFETPATLRPGLTEPLDGLWLADAEFLVLKPELLGSVFRTARLSGFVLESRSHAAPERP